MKDDGAFLGGLIVGGIIGIVLGLAVGLSFVEQTAIDYGIAHYDSRTGDLVWHEKPMEGEK